jgi:hypothetical protein
VCGDGIEVAVSGQKRTLWDRVYNEVLWSLWRHARVHRHMHLEDLHLVQPPVSSHMAGSVSHSRPPRRVVSNVSLWRI